MSHIAKFLQAQRAEATRAVYKKAIKSFLFFTCGEGDADKLGDRYIKQMLEGMRNPLHDLLGFLNSPKLKEKSPMWQAGQFSVAKLFLEFCGKEFTSGELRQMKAKTKGLREVLTADRAPKVEEIKAMLTHATPLLRCVLHIANSTGMRRSEILALTTEMVDLTADPATIILPAKVTKNREGRVVYLTHEAVEELKLWMQHRNEYLKRIKSSGNKIISTKKANEARIKSDKLFPIKSAALGEQWTLALRKTGYTKKNSNTGRYVVHFHSFRKRFRTELAKGSGSASDYVELLLGNRSLLHEAYLRREREEIGKWFKENEHLLYVNAPVIHESPELRKELAEKEARIKELETRMEELRAVVSLVLENNKKHNLSSL